MEVVIHLSNESQILVHDLNSGQSIATFKGNSVSKLYPGRTLKVCNSPGYGNSPPALIFSAERGRAMLYCWNLKKDQPFLKFVIPEELTAMAVSNSGTFFCGGTGSGRVYLWEIATGALIKVIDAHYKQIRVISFTTDDAAICTGSEDAIVNIWMMNQILQNSESNAPYRSLSGHNLPVTDLHCGYGLFQFVRIFTASLDSTCKIWNLKDGNLLVTLLFPSPLSSITVDPVEQMLFTGSTTGTIFITHLRKWGDEETEASGKSQGFLLNSYGDKNIEDLTSNEAEGSITELKGHETRVNSMSISYDGSKLVSGSTDAVIVWEVDSGVIIRKMTGGSNVVVVQKAQEMEGDDLIGGNARVTPFGRYEAR